MAANSQELIERLFLEPEEYEESPLRDRKQDFPTNQADEKKKAELVRDFIALANTAALRGEPAYLLWGIKDDPPEVIGIEKALRVCASANAVDDSKVRDAAGNWICNWIKAYVEPLHEGFAVHYGKANDHLVACLEITPQVTHDGRPFRVKRDFGSATVQLKSRQAWIRAGANKFELGPELINETDPRYRFNWRTVPYILPSTMQRYLEALQRSNFVAQWNEVRSYRESRLADGRTLDQAVDQMLADSSARMLVVEGAAGTGKSTLIQRRVHEVCGARLEELRGIVNRMEYALPKEHIPVILVLRDVRDTLCKQGLARTITNEIKRFAQAGKPNWDPKVTEPGQILHDEDLKWLVFLDGVDELGDYTRKFVDQIKGFVVEYNRVRVIMTMRTDAVYEDWASLDGVMSVKMELLTDEQVRDYLRSADAHGESTAEAIGFLDDNSDFAELCRTPAFLARAAKELVPESTIAPADNSVKAEVILPFASTAIVEDESDVPTLTAVPYSGQDKAFDTAVDEPTVAPEVISVRKGVLLKNVYDYLWERELKKSGVDRAANDWKRGVGELALLTDGAKPKFGQNAIKASGVTKQAREWLLMLGVLVKPVDDQYSFQANLTKLHFGSQRTAALLESGDLEEAKRRLSQCQPTFRLDLLEILHDVTDADLSQLS